MTPTEVWLLPAGTRSGRHEFLIQKVADRLALSPTKVALNHHASGQPFVPNADINVSLSRSGSKAAVSFSTSGPIGVDLQEIPPPDHLDDILIRNVLTRSEREEYGRSTHPRASMFAAFWTRKEAALKAMGVGLSVDARSVAFPIVQFGVSQPFRLPDQKPYFVATWELFGTHLLSICTPDRDVAVYDGQTFNPERSDKPIIRQGTDPRQRTVGDIYHNRALLP